MHFIVCVLPSIDLHSTVVLLSRKRVLGVEYAINDLHSTVVLLSPFPLPAAVTKSTGFTFYCSSIKPEDCEFLGQLPGNLHSTVVLLSQTTSVTYYSIII